MKYKLYSLLILVSAIQAHSQTTVQLKGVTFGIGIGMSYLHNKPQSYFLSPDSNALHLQPLSKTSFVVSSMLSIKLGKLGVQDQTRNNQTKKTLVNLKKINENPGAKEYKAKQSTESTFASPGFFQRLEFNIGLNLLDISSESISFNKSIDGGLGFGYYINENIQIAVFYDMIRIRQMRDYIVDHYNNRRIPNGAEYFNALDENNNNLFYNKNFSGASIKAIFSLGNK
jgi:hypothetical protein